MTRADQVLGPFKNVGLRIPQNTISMCKLNMGARMRNSQIVTVHDPEKNRYLSGFG